MENIIDSIVQLMNVSKHNKLVNDFARSKYDEKFPQYNPDGSYIHHQGWRAYKGFEIISKTEIRINYDYGAGDYEYSESFIVSLVPEIRDSKIDEIIK